eukprot:2490361-Pleurochrysis_carterae.AAC.1
MKHSQHNNESRTALATAEPEPESKSEADVALSALFAQGGGDVAFTLDVQGRALCIQASDTEPSAEPITHSTACEDSLFAPAAPNAPIVSTASGDMNHYGASGGATSVRRVGKSSDPDHPFHPCDDVDSDDAEIEALLDSSSRGTRSEELDYDPTDPYRDPFAPHVPHDSTCSPVDPPSERTDCVRIVLPEHQAVALKRMHDQLAAARASREQTVIAQPVVAGRASSENRMAGHGEDETGERVANRAVPVSAALPDADAPHVHVPERRESTASELNTIREQLASLIASGSPTEASALRTTRNLKATLHRRLIAFPHAPSCRFSSTSLPSALPSRSAQDSYGTTVCWIRRRLSPPACSSH